MEIDREDAVGARHVDEIGDQLRRDGRAAIGLAVLPRVAEIRNDRRDPLGAGPHQGVDHDQQFHQMVVGRRAGRLDHIDVLAADILVHPHEDFAVLERFHLGVR